MADDYGATVGAGNLGTVTVGGSATGTIEVGADRDWFRITLVAGQSYIFNLDRGTLIDPFLVLFDHNGVDVVGNDDIVPGSNFNSQIRFTATVSGTYYLQAFSSDGSDTGTYTVRAAIDPSPPASIDDYGAQAGSPNVGNVAIGGSTTGNLETLNDRDWFAVTLTAGTSYSFRQNSGTLADPLLRLRDGNGVLIAGDDDGGGGLNSLITYTAVTTGVYYLEANTADAGNAAGTGTYTVSAVVNGTPPPPPADDFGSQVGAGNLASVAVGSSSTGLINYGGDHDWFTVTLSAGSIYRIRQEIGTLADPRFTLRNSIGVGITGDDDSGGGQNAQVDFTATTSGIYYIDANSADGNGTGNYTVRVTLLYGAPVIATNTGSTGAEGATDTITSSELSTTDADSAASAIIYTLTSLATNGTLTRSGSAIALNGTFTQADINANLIVFNHNGSETTSASFGFSVTDGTTNFAGRTFDITVNLVNDAPNSTGLQGDSVTTTETAGTGSTVPTVKIDVGGNATLTDVDNLNFNGGSIRFAITAGRAGSQDQLNIDTAAATTVTVAAGTVSVGGTAIGTVSGGGAGGSDLVVMLNASSTPARVQALIRAIDFSNTGGDNPTAGARTITTTLIDGGGTANGGVDTRTITSTVNVVAADDAPVAVADVGNVLENGTIVGGSVLGNDSDADGPALSVSAVNGTAGSVGSQITLASGALLTVNANGTYNYNPNGQFNYLIDAATAATTGATNSSATDSFTYTLAGGQTATVTITINGVSNPGDQLRGNGGNNIIGGTTGADFFDLSQGGNDTASGGAGDDAFLFGSTFSALDSVDGGSGTNDQVGISGNYTGGNALVLGATTLTNVEVLALLPGAGNSYAITSNDSNVAAGQRLTIFAGNLAAGQNFTFDGSAETDGEILTYGGLGTDSIIGGARDDAFYFGPGRWQAGDSVVGGGGTNDQLALDGNYAITIGANADVETLALLSGPVGTPNTFIITLADSWVGAGSTRTVWGGQVTTALNINGAGETNGNLTIFGGRSNDTLTGGAGNDLIFGGAGDDEDVITGGLGSDTAGFSGLRADYLIITNNGNVRITDANAADGDDGVDRVVGIEFAQFSDQTISITSPIILDLDGGGVSTLSAAQSNAAYDMDGDGIGDDTSWFGRGEGLLFLDRDGNGTLSNTGEMSFTSDVANARSDLEGLRAWDSNGDGQLSSRDARFRDFKIWRDRDGDGVVDTREVMSLNRAGVRSLSLSGTANNATTALGDTAIVNQGSFTRTNGRQGGLVDAVLTAFASSDAARQRGISALAQDDPLTALRDAVAADTGALGGDFDPRVALMAQDMASFGASDSGAAETDRWRRNGATNVELFAA